MYKFYDCLLKIYVCRIGGNQPLPLMRLYTVRKSVLILGSIAFLLVSTLSSQASSPQKLRVMNDTKDYLVKVNSVEVEALTGGAVRREIPDEPAFNQINPGRKAEASWKSGWIEYQPNKGIAKTHRMNTSIWKKGEQPGKSIDIPLKSAPSPVPILEGKVLIKVTTNDSRSYGGANGGHYSNVDVTISEARQ